MYIEEIDIKDIEFGEPIEEKEPTYRDGYIRGIYRARNIIDSKQKEIERLNNIMAQLEIELYAKYHEYKDSECEELYAKAQEDKEILDYIKELKGSDK